MRMLVVAAVVATLAGCAGLGAGDGGTELDISGAWQLESGTLRGTAIQPPAGHRITLVETDGRWGGTAACNHYGADIQTNGAAVSITVGAVTEMACESHAMEAEAAFLEALGLVETGTRRGEQLVLTGPEVELRFSQVPPVTQGEMRDTVRLLESRARHGGG